MLVKHYSEENIRDYYLQCMIKQSLCKRIKVLTVATQQTVGFIYFIILYARISEKLLSASRNQLHRNISLKLDMAFMQFHLRPKGTKAQRELESLD